MKNRIKSADRKKIATAIGKVYDLTRSNIPFTSEESDKIRKAESILFEIGTKLGAI